MSNIFHVKRVTDEHYPEFASYEVTTVDNQVYTVKKEFYADGPSMFVWRCAGPRIDDEEFNTKKACLRAIENLYG